MININEVHILLTYLSLVQVNTLWNSIDSKKNDEILVWRYNIPITRKSFNTIHTIVSSDQSSGWLNDEVKQTTYRSFVVQIVFAIHLFL